MPRSVREVVSFGRLAGQLLELPLFFTAVDPQGCSCLRLSIRGCSPPLRDETKSQAPSIHVAMEMAHVSMTADIGMMLLLAQPALKITLLCKPEFDVEGAHMYSCKKMCDLAPRFCSSPRVTQEPDAVRVEEALASSDLHVCFEYGRCAELRSKFRKPLILYDGGQYGCPRNGFPDPSWAHLALLRGLLEHDVLVAQRQRAPAQLLPHEIQLPRSRADRKDVVTSPTLVFTTDPWHAESLFFLTGLRVPSVRANNMYLTCRHNPGKASRDVIISNDRGRSIVCDTFAKTLKNAAPENYPLNLVHSWEYLSFCEIASARAMILLPHGNVMQMLFREAVNMALPVFVPDPALMAKQPFLWWFDRISNILGPDGVKSFANPPQPEGFRAPHPFSPFVIAHAAGPERVRAVLYWMRFLDYYHWPGVLHFSSLPHLLYMLVHADLDDASSQMLYFVRRQRRLSIWFWRDSLSRLLSAEPKPGFNSTIWWNASETR
ncbi:unnamed protein product [Polarella glacialis]|uniref:Uncharacterized protein n=1 Tax=Polarella glacialis TaxID=89957 RepID=A0A813HCF4_POLGL|nr:unnamed protein product [Polarella glacialis]